MVEAKVDWGYKKMQYNLNTDIYTKVSSLENEVLKNIGDFRELSCNYSNDGESHEEELKVLADKNKTTRHKLECKLEELSRKKTQYQNFKSDQKLLSEEVKDRHEALLMVKKYYKKHLKIYFTIESKNQEYETIFLQFFTETKRDTDNYSVRLRRTFKSDTYELLEANPTLRSHEELKRMFQDNDMPGAICHIRRAFLNMKKGKKHN